MLLIKEHVDSVKSLILEDKNTKEKSYFIEGIFMQSNKKNKNNRIYSKDVLVNEVSRYTQDKIQRNNAFGELGHPDTPVINLDRVSHIIKEMRIDGNDIIGKAKIMGPKGDIVKDFINEGVVLGVSSRGIGTVMQDGNGTDRVDKDFLLAAVDIVADPSAPDAFVQGIMESKEWMISQNGRFVERAQQIIQNTPSKELEQTAIKLLEAFVNSYVSEKY